MNPKKILVVDDEVDLVKTVSFSLEAEGYTVLVSYNGEDALNQARKENPDLILLDIMLPKLDGYKVCRLLKFDERYKHIPVLMLTAKTQEKDKIVGMETGADEYIAKPFDMDELMEKIKTYLNKLFGVISSELNAWNKFRTPHSKIRNVCKSCPISNTR
jgi:DNA-binding response OmpR family regulator